MESKNNENCIWNDVAPFSEGLARVRDNNGLYGFINKKGEIVIPCIYEDAVSFNEGYAKVTIIGESLEDLDYRIDKLGKVYSKKEFELIKNSPSKNSYSIEIPSAWAEKYNLITETKTCINPFGFGEEPKMVSTKVELFFKDGVSIITNMKGESGIINEKGELITPFIWKSIHGYSNQLTAVVNNKNQYGYLNLNGEIEIPIQFDLLYDCIELDFQEGLAAVVNKDWKWGFIDSAGKLVIPHRYVEVSSFKEGRAKVKAENGLYGFINYKGEPVGKFCWKTAYDFDYGIACVQHPNGKFGFINKHGDIFERCIYDDACVEDGRPMVCLNEKWVYLDILDEARDNCWGENLNPPQAFGKYHGSYAQDEAGYSDEDIDTILDGDPSAYWNID